MSYKIIRLLIILLVLKVNGITQMNSPLIEWNFKTYEYKKVDNCSIYADCYLQSSAKNSPVIIYVHGGALMSGTRKDVEPKQLELFIKSGYSVIFIDYRLSPETKLNYIIEDVQDAIKWVKNNGQKLLGVDVNRIAVMGSSAGGYLALMTGTFKVKPQVIISLYGYGDITADWYVKPHYLERRLISKEEAYKQVFNYPISELNDRALINDRYFIYMYCRQKGLWPIVVSGFDPISEKNKLLPYCPLYNIKKDYPPTLLLHGDKDTDVPYEQSVEMAKELSRVGVKNNLITIKDGGHVFDINMESKIVKDAFNSIIEFLDSNIKK